MKWLLFLLVGLNLILGFMHWADLRSQRERPQYALVSPTVDALKLLYEESDSLQEDSNAPTESLCWLVGPFLEKERADSVKQAISSARFRTRIIDQELNKAPGYWVYYGPFETETDRLEQLDIFQEQDIDGFIIRSGGLKGYISLGVFRNIDTARRKLKSLAARNYKAKMSEIEKTDHEYWIALAPRQTGVNKAEVATEFKGLDSPPVMRQIFCKTVASDMEFL